MTLFRGRSRGGWQGLNEEKVRIDSEGIGYLLDIPEGNAATLAFDGADIGAMEPAFIGEGLLGQTKLLTIMSHVLAENVQNIHAYLHKPRED